jgi:hypothetical protein
MVFATGRRICRTKEYGPWQALISLATGKCLSSGAPKTKGKVAKRGVSRLSINDLVSYFLINQ